MTDGSGWDGEDHPDQANGRVQSSRDVLATDFTFTGQRGDYYIDIMAMGVRWFSPRAARWISADSIIPDPSNPQSFNRFSYVYNNPLRYRDPTGHLSEDQIMSHFGVDTWDEVLAFFEQGRALEGRWGWLRTLREARIGDEIQIFEQYAGFWPPPGPAPARLALRGILANDQGQLQLFSAEGVYALSEAAAMGNAYGVVRQNPAGMPPTYVGPYQNQRIYYETVVGIDPSRCDGVGAALDIGGLLLDTITLGQGSRATNLAKVARGLKKLVDVVSISLSWPPVAISLSTGDLAPGDGVGFVLDIAGVVSPVPFIPDILSLGANLSEAVTVERRP